MGEKEDIVREFFKYCSKCDGKCCKRGVFTVFGWEDDLLSREYEEFKDADIFDVRGSCKDIAMMGKCIFYKEDGCKLPKQLRPTDCISFPFYPKLKENKGVLEIESILIQNECPFSEEISKNEKLIRYMYNFWEGVIKRTTKQEIIDWIGINGSWHDWYDNAIEVKCDFPLNVKGNNKK